MRLLASFSVLMLVAACQAPPAEMTEAEIAPTPVFDHMTITPGRRRDDAAATVRVQVIQRSRGWHPHAKGESQTRIQHVVAQSGSCQIMTEEDLPI